MGVENLIRSRRLALLEAERKSKYKVSVASLMQYFLDHVCLKKKWVITEITCKFVGKNHIRIKNC